MLMGIREYGRHRNVSHVAVIKAVQDGRIKKDSSGKIDSDLADLAWNENTDPTKQRKQETTARPPGSQLDPQHPSVATSRAKEAALKVKLLEMEFEQKSGELVSLKTVTKEAFECGRRVRDMMEAIPVRVSAILVAMTDRREIETLLAKEISNALADLQKGREY
ncbi:MAG: hypothetical protein H7839_12535 [Magnetococcus sp. YQC-5]